MKLNRETVEATTLFVESLSRLAVRTFAAILAVYGFFGILGGLRRMVKRNPTPESPITLVPDPNEE